MARRHGKKGDYLLTDDYTGFTVYASKVQEDYWGNLTVKPLQRNLQEISSPLLDPYPETIYRGPQYEVTTACQFESQPATIGLTNKPTPNSYAAQVLNLNPTLGVMEVGCTFQVF